MNKLCALILCCVCTWACHSPSHPTFTDTPTSGDITILVDESYRPMIQVLIDTFLKIYKYASIKVKYLPETELFDGLMKDSSIRLAVTARDLNPSEQLYFDSVRIIPRKNKIAIDGVAIIVHRDNPDSLLKFEQLKSIMQGKIRTWKQLNPRSSDDTIRIVFDQSGSANTRFLREKFLGEQSFPSNTYALRSNAEVVDYVSKTNGAMGVISVNWISDKDAPSANSFLQKIRVASIARPDTSESAPDYCKPMQAYIALKEYPLIRDVYIISREGRNGLGTGFAAFVAGDQGQRLIKLMGMLPATLPVRIVQIHS